MYCFYQCIAAAYSCYYILQYLKVFYQVDIPNEIEIFAILPYTLYVWWVDDAITLSHMTLVGLLYGALTSSAAAFGFLSWQIYIIIRGQTTYEARRGIHDYKGTLRQNFFDVFGRYWYVSFFLPLPLPQRSNGIYLNGKNDDRIT